MHHDDSIGALADPAVLPGDWARNAMRHQGRQRFARDDDTGRRQLPDTTIEGQAGLGISLNQQIAGDLYNPTAC